MKKAITLIRRSLCLMAAAALAFPSVAVRAEAGHPVYKITFAGRGESKTVDEVLVENLSNGQSASLRGQDTLLLKAKGDLTAIGSLRSGTAGDLRIADGRVQLALPQPSSVQIAVYTMDGRLAWQTACRPPRARHRWRFPRWPRVCMWCAPRLPDWSRA